MNKTRLRQFLALFLVLCMLCSTTLPIYAETSTGEVTPVETSVSVATPENAASDAGTEKSPADTSSLPSATTETALSEAAQAFVDAVAALDRESILTAINAWGLASQAWQADQSNAELTAALEAATEASDAAAAPVYAAEDLYMALSDEEREIDAVKAAYSSLTALFVSMQLAMQNPVAPGGGGDEPDLEEIATVLYGDLPDAPTGSYIGEYGLPVATGDTKISISAWKHDLLDASSKGRLDADALNETNAVMTAAKQDGTDYAIVPIAVQVEYPANGATTTVTLPDSVELLSYTSTAENLVVASEKERAQILNASYKDSSASASGFYVKATEDFSVTFTYSAPDGTTISKKLDVSINGSAESAALPASNSNGVSTYANTPQPPFTTGKITKIEYVVSTWLVWFNGVEAYCCDNGLYAAPGGCPTYSFAYVSKLEPGQYTPGNHYANQINIWGGLNQLSMGLLSKSHDANDFAGSSFAASAAATYSTTGNEVLKTAYEYYNDTQLWIIEHYPNSVAAQTYLNSISALSGENIVTPYVNPGDNGYYTYAYFPPAGYNWQRIVVVDLNPISDDDDTSGLPDVPEMQYYSADWTAPPQSASGSFDLTYTVHIDKSANITHEKLDDAIFKLTPNPSSGTISGGTWTIGDPQIVTTVDGAASATWTLHYEVTKTSTTTLSGKEGPYNTQEEANAAAEAAKNNAIAQLQNEAQSMVDAAIAEAKDQLAKITIDYEETTVPHGFDPTDSSSGSVSVPSNGSTTAVVANQPWQAHVTWEKRDALTGGRITEDAEYVFYEWNVDANEYEISSNYRVTRLENGLYTVTVTNPVYTDWTEGYVYYTQDNLGKFRIEEVTAPAGYTDAALQGTDWVEHWSQEFEITASDQTYSYTGDDADYNRPQGNKVIIKKIEAHTGEIIVDDAVFTLYQWNEERGLYEKSKDYAFVRDTEGLYTITCLHDDWSQYEEGNLYYEDTLCDVREDTVNSDGTTTEHPQYYTDYEPIDFSIDERAVTTDGQFVVVESKSPYGYYGDWTGSRETPNFEVEDAGKHAYYIRLTDDGSTITLTDSEYNAHVLTENKGGTLIELGDGSVVTLDVFSPALEEYDENNLFRNNPWYSTVVWEKRDALTGGLVDADTTFEIQEWNPEKGEYEKSTHYQVVRREDGKYTVHLIGDAFFEGWEGKQGVLYYHQANQGKYRIVELKAPASYNLKAWEHNNWVIGWSEEIIVHPDYPTYEFLGETASRNMPYKTKVLIKKVDDATGEFILPDTTWTLYEWNERNNQYEVSTNYKIVRREDGYYTVTTLHSDWTHYEEGYLYFEDTQTDYPDSGRWFSNEGKFLIVESQAPAGYYGDYWRNDEPGTHSTDNGSDLGKRGYAFTLTEDNGTLWLTNADYNAKILYDVDDQLGNATLVLADGRPTSVIINEDKQPEYNRPETAFTNKAKYGYVEFDRSQYRKEWAQTGDETYTVTYDATTEEPEKEHLTAPNQLRWQNGMLYRLSDYTATLISGPVECQVETADIRSLEAVPATVEYDVGGQPVQLQLASAAWIQQPQEKHTGYVDMGYSPTQPKFEETSTFTAEDGTEFVGHLVEVEQTGDYQWISTEIPATYHGWPDVKGIYLGNLVLPHNDLEPVYEGYENDILDYLGLDPSTHHITGAAWTGSWQGQPGEDMMIRPAVFDLQVYATGWVGVYEDDAENQSGVALATYRLGGDENTDGLYHWTVTAHYHPMLSALQAAAAVLGVALLIAALVALLFILSRRRKETNKRTEVH